MTISLIGLDADDTLWHNETIFRATQSRFVELLAGYCDAARVEPELEAVERRNLDLYGYGAKGFTLSMLETALGLSDHKLRGEAVAEILAMGRDMMRHPVEPLPGVEEAIEALARLGRVVLITKGDLFHQEAKLAASGLGAFFAGVEIVSEKSPETYRRIFRRYDVSENEALMAGNSVRSDILPPLDIGGYAALIPYPLVWAHESADVPHGHPRFRELDSLADLPTWIETINSVGA
ncbi:HAD family hydrolase [Lichenifustis flavocetrariae]|uniref:HAD family hydrolase n=1 Tax=Lichenifustis flavocetrariae TaxID=2949735 RepID=A0AA42CLB5_9HYPH|nr:HAD family hydrolase [Lichenifustis flavocetrariae]MCW6507130.1 HAD family hydrolase [Lichenifustis flavocetrariae]